MSGKKPGLLARLMGKGGEQSQEQEPAVPIDRVLLSDLDHRIEDLQGVFLEQVALTAGMAHQLHLANRLTLARYRLDAKLRDPKANDQKAWQEFEVELQDLSEMVVTMSPPASDE